MDNTNFGTPQNISSTVTFSGKLNEKMLIIDDLNTKIDRLNQRVERLETKNLQLMADKEEMGKATFLFTLKVPNLQSIALKLKTSNNEVQRMEIVYNDKEKEFQQLYKAYNDLKSEHGKSILHFQSPRVFLPKI